jgi:hypothetical protein
VNDRQFLWGLSNGVTVFAIAGAFWLGLGIGTVATDVGWLVCALSTAVQVGVCAALLWAAVRLRRRSGFLASELRQGNGRGTPETQHILTGLRWTIAAQTAVVGLAVWACVRAAAEPLIWPAIALVVSLHLLPLARIFHVRAYYATAAAGSAVSLVAFAMETHPYGVVFLAGAMATVMWLSAWYLLVNADKIAARATGERWAV